MTYNYEKSDKQYTKMAEPSFCACMGRVYGEPFCPCEMSRRELPMSKAHVIQAEKDKAELDKLFRGLGALDG